MEGRLGRATLVLSTCCALLAACRSGAGGSPDASFDAPPWSDGEAEAEPRPGMVWVGPGVLIAGTPPDRIPRVADEEMPGEQVVMRGFYVDLYPYPNEVGAIPTTNLSQADAKELCGQQDKRLCTELELERACKGPENSTYEYGDAYKPSACGTGAARALTPNGLNAACASGFGVHDLHGGIWSWTSSTWNRDQARPGLVTQRGGNGDAGELLGRCANGRGVRPDSRRPDVGVRCCAGDPNTFEVVLDVTRGEPLKWQQPPTSTSVRPSEDPARGRASIAKLGADAAFRFERQWVWRPLGNEELLVAGGCAHTPSEHRACGVLIARMRLEGPQLLAWVASDWWQPTVSEADLTREFFLHGGDVNGAFRRRVTYAWGRVTIAEKERKKRHKGEREARY